MTWDKPKNTQQWLLLFLPAALCVLPTLMGGLLEPKNGGWIAWSLMGLLLATLTALVLSVWLARVNPTSGGKMGCAILCFVIFMAVNGAVSFAGCAVGWSTLPGMDFR